GDPVRPETRPGLAKGAVDRGCRPHADAGQGIDARPERVAAGAAARDAAVLPFGSALRHGAARLRTGGAAAVSLAARRTHDRGARQGQQGTAGAAQRSVAAGDGRLSRRDGSAQTREEERRRPFEMVVSLLRRERPSDAAAFCPRPEGAGGGIGPRAAAGLAARAAPRLCQPSASYTRGP